MKPGKGCFASNCIKANIIGKMIVDKKFRLNDLLV